MTLKLLTVSAAARELGLCRSTLYQLFRRGTLRRVKAGRRRLVPLVELRRLVEGPGRGASGH